MRIFGRHLHNQIVAPLVIVALALGVVSAIVGLVLTTSIVVQWIDEQALSMVEVAADRADRLGADLGQDARVVATNAALRDALARGDDASAARVLAVAQLSLRCDSLVVADSSGVVLASAGDSSLAEGSQAPGVAYGVASFVDLGGAVALSAAYPFGDDLIIASRVVDDSFAAELQGGLRGLLAVYDAEGVLIALDAPDTPAGRRLEAAVRSGDSEQARRLEEAPDAPGGVQAFSFGRDDYRLAAAVIGSDEAIARGHVVAAFGSDIVERTRQAGIGILLMSALLAVFALLVLNWWVARSASQPLAKLAAGVAHVAEGDYGKLLVLGGHNEITELADGFNRMTDSLRERSESLTKKVLELATLYDMSRTLGSTLDLEPLLDTALESMTRIFGVELGCVSLIDPADGSIRIKAARGLDGGRPDELAVRSSMSDWVIREGRPLIFNPPRDAEDREGEGSLAALSVPLRSVEGVSGALMVGSRDSNRRFTSDDVRLLATIANQLTVAVGNIDLFSTLQEAYLATVRALAAAVDAKDPYTRGHSERVASYALLIAEPMGITPEQRVALEMAAYLHDIGKIGIAEGILLKPGTLSEEEMVQMRHHPLIGAAILRPVAFPWPIAPVVRHHHEHFDGNGYPAGLRGDEIPALARVLAVADAFEAMVSDRPYRRGRDRYDAIAELRRCSGSQFDPRVVDVFVSMLERLDEAERLSPTEARPDLGPDEAMAALVAISDGMFSAFRRLGGPRLAANLEDDLNACFTEQSLPFSFDGGHLAADETWLSSAEDHVEVMRIVLELVTSYMERASGASLVEGFFAEATETLPERLRGYARSVGLDRGAKRAG